MRTAADPIPKLIELRMEALHADGSRTYLTFLPELDGSLRVEIEQKELGGDVPVDVLPRGLVQQTTRTTEHQLTVRDVGLLNIEHLVRASRRQ